MVHDLPVVGEGLQDHILTVVGPVLLNEPVSVIINNVINPGSILDYALNGQGK